MSNERDPNFRKAIHSTTRLSENSEVDKLKRYRGFNTIRLWRNFRTHLESVPEALQSQSRKLIPLADLAKSLGVEVKRLLPALEHGYLKLVSADPPMVYEPPPAAIEWLRIMFLPLAMRPFLSSEMVGKLEGLSAESVRRLCLDYGIPIYSDPVFGELMSISSFYRFHEQMHHQREPSRFDRQAMLWALMHQMNEWRENVKPPSFSKRVEIEIRRIADLEEPARTDAVLRFWEAWKDGETVSKVLAAARGVPPPPPPHYIKQVERMLQVELPEGTILSSGDHLESTPGSRSPSNGTAMLDPS